MERFFETRDPRLREELVRRYMRFARSMAYRYKGRGEPSDDLVQVACLGLVHAIDRFDPTKGKPFLAFAAPTVLGELRRHLRDRVWMLRLPRGLQDRARQVEAVIESLTAETGRPPTVGEIAARVVLDPDEVLEVLEASSTRRVSSLDVPVIFDEQGSEALIARIGELDRGYEHVEEWTTVTELLPVLSREEREVLRLRFVEDITQAEIGQRIGRSQMHVSRVLRRAIEQLREAYQPAAA